MMGEVRPGAYADDEHGTPAQRATIAQLAEEYQSVEVLGYVGPIGAPGIHVRCHISERLSGQAIVTFGGQIAGIHSSPSPDAQGQGGR